MTAETQAQEQQQGQASGGGLLHGGTYQLYQTPSGGLHITFRREYYPENGAIVGIPEDEMGWEHLPFEIPAQLIRAATEAQAEFDRTGKQPSKKDMLKLVLGIGLGE